MQRYSWPHPLCADDDFPPALFPDPVEQNLAGSFDVDDASFWSVLGKRTSDFFSASSPEDWSGSPPPSPTRVKLEVSDDGGGGAGNSCDGTGTLCFGGDGGAASDCSTQSTDGVVPALPALVVARLTTGDLEQSPSEIALLPHRPLRVGRQTNNRVGLVVRHLSAEDRQQLEAALRDAGLLEQPKDYGCKLREGFVIGVSRVKPRPTVTIRFGGYILELCGYSSKSVPRRLQPVIEYTLPVFKSRSRAHKGSKQKATEMDAAVPAPSVLGSMPSLHDALALTP